MEKVTYNPEAKFDYFNSLYFDNLLPSTDVYFCDISIKDAVGTFYTKSKRIELSNELLSQTELHIDHVLIHEMIHYYNKLNNLDIGSKHHGKAFKTKVDEINKKSNNKYRLTCTDISMTLDVTTEVIPTFIYALLPLYRSSVSLQNLARSIQFFTIDNYNSKYLDELALIYKDVKDVKALIIAKVEINNNYISEDWLKNLINKKRISFWPDAKDKYFFKMMKQSKQYTLVGGYNWDTQVFEKLKSSKVHAMKETSKITTWYHGSSSPKRENPWNINYVGNGNDQEGSGIYFTSNYEDATGYTKKNSNSGYVYTVELRTTKWLSTKLRPNSIILRRLIELADDYESVLENWGNENKEKDMRDCLKDLLDYNDTLFEAIKSICSDFYKNNGTGFCYAMTALGYDGVIIKKSFMNTYHAIVWNPKIIKTIDY